MRLAIVVAASFGLFVVVRVLITSERRRAKVQLRLPEYGAAGAWATVAAAVYATIVVLAVSYHISGDEDSDRVSSTGGSTVPTQDANDSDLTVTLKEVLRATDLPATVGVYSEDSSAVGDEVSFLTTIGYPLSDIIDENSYTDCPRSEGSCDTVNFAVIRTEMTDFHIDYPNLDAEYHTDYSYDISHARCVQRRSAPGESICVGLLAEGAGLIMRWHPNYGGDTWDFLDSHSASASMANDTYNVVWNALIEFRGFGGFEASLSDESFSNQGATRNLVLQVEGGYPDGIVDFELAPPTSEVGGVCPELASGPCNLLATNIIYLDASGKGSAVIAWSPCASVDTSGEASGADGTYTLAIRDRESAQSADLHFTVSSDSRTPPRSAWQC